MSKTLHTTDQEDRIPIGRKLAYGAGGVNDALMGNVFHNMVNPVFNMMLGVSTSVIGLALFIPNLWNAFSDPIVGHLSDQTKSRFGRRRPYLIAGAVFAAVSLLAIWLLAGYCQSEGQFFWLILIGAIAFFTGTTVYLIPWNALGFEMTADYHERTRLMFFRSIMAQLAGFSLPWIAAIIFWKGFSTPLHGATWLSVAFGIIFIACAILPAFFCRERLQEQASSQKKVALLAGLKELSGNKPFLMVVGTVLLLISSFFIVDVLGQYLLFYYIYDGDKAAGAVLHGYNGTLNSALSLLFIPIATWLSTHFGKRHVIVVFMFIAALGASLRWFFYTPDTPYLILISTALIAPGFSALWLLVPSLLADVCDYEELRSGRRAEGTIGAVYGWVTKLGFSLAFLIGNLSLDFVGFDISLGGEQSAATFHWMRVLFVSLPAVGFALGGIMMVWYPLSVDRMYAIKDELKLKNGVPRIK